MSEGVARINSILPSKDTTTLIDALQYEYVDLIGVDPDNVPHYLALLTTLLDNKIEVRGITMVTIIISKTSDNYYRILIHVVSPWLLII